MRWRTNGASSTSSSPPRIRRRGWPPSSRSALPTSRAADRVSLGNPDRPVGGLAVPRPDGVDLRPLGRDDFTDALALARELYALDTDADPEPHRGAYDALVGDV